ncbi:hypothetical protein HMPREF0239_01017 [Clostridium sp. ATCC BAA-442]|nr:hypothetical protein HMPREF0239_01017 [Clostridium sp. ATCC BAA-442]
MESKILLLVLLGNRETPAVSIEKRDKKRRKHLAFSEKQGVFTI